MKAMFHRYFILLGALLMGTQVHAARAPMMTVPALGKSSANVEAVYMLNGDIISGKFLRFDPKVGLVWEAKNIKPAIQIDPVGTILIDHHDSGCILASQLA